MYSKDPAYCILSQILCSLYLHDLFYLSNFTKVCNFADDTTFHGYDNDLNNLIKRLERNAFLATEWFETSNMKLNKDKCHLLVSGHKYENIWFKIKDEKIWESAKQKLLGMEKGRNLNMMIM